MVGSARGSVVRLVIALATPLLFLFALVAWSFASPVGASPDDDFHLPSIWCGLGERPGLCEDTGDPATRSVPASLATAACFAFDPTRSAACWEPDAVGLVEIERVNTAPLYPPLFYAAMSVFASENVPASVVIMRIANAALLIGVLTAVFWALPRWLRPALVVSTTASAVPLGLFILASNNPSSWAVVSAATVWICLYAATQTEGARRIILCFLAVVGGLMGAGARADAAAFAIFGILIAAVLGVRVVRGIAWPALTAVVIAVISVIFYLGARQGGSVVAGLPSQNPPLTLGQHVDNLLAIPSLWVGALGGWGLGWLDTALPSSVSVLSVFVACGAVFVGIRVLSGRRVIALLLAIAAMWLVPFVLLAQTRAVVGEQVQPRYVLPLMVIFLGVVTAAASAERWWFGPRFVVAAIALSSAGAVALHTNIRRYTTGLDDQAIDPGSGAEWWWAGALSPMATWVLGSLAFAAALALVGVSMRRDQVTTVDRSTADFDDVVAVPSDARTVVRR